MDMSSLPVISVLIFTRHSVLPWAMKMTVRFGICLGGAGSVMATHNMTESQNSYRAQGAHESSVGTFLPQLMVLAQVLPIQDLHPSRKGTHAWRTLKRLVLRAKTPAFSQQLLSHQLVLHHPHLSNQIRSLQKMSFITCALMYMYIRAYTQGCWAGLIRQAAVSIPLWPFACHWLKSKELKSFTILF